MKIKKFSVFQITDDSELIEKILGNDDTPVPGSRFLVIDTDKTWVDVILEDYNGEFDLEGEPTSFALKDFKKIAECHGTICRGKVNSF